VSKIHQMSVVSPEAQIAEDAIIGPFCVVGPNVKIGSGTELVSHCNVVGHTEIGENNILYAGVSVGTPPEDISYTGYVSYLKIGNGNIFREGFTANVGEGEGSETIIGNNCYFMANSHVSHNCKVGDRVIAVISSGFAGYTEVGDGFILSGLSGTHQFVRVGRYAMMSGGSVTSKDIPPFVIADGRNGAIKSLNIVGLRRNGFARETIKTLKDLFKIYFKSDLSVPNALAKIESEVEQIPEVKEFVEFVRASKRGVATGQASRRL
jgi:UDP-N-acetylglucosamine acyltransferase